MNLRTFALVALLLPGCVRAHTFAGPHGERMVEATCNGGLNDMGDCMEKAREACGGDFDVVNQDQHTEYAAAANAYGGSVTPVNKRSLLGQCRGP